MKHAREDYNPRIQDSAGLIPDDEPVFLLRAQDVNAALLVDIWALLAARAGCSAEIVAMAREHATRMHDWPVKKRPDLP